MFTLFIPTANRLSGNAPEQSKVTAQVIFAPNPSLQQQQQQPRKGFTASSSSGSSQHRRYSRPQATGTEDTFDSDAVLQNFTNSLTFSSQVQRRRQIGQSGGQGDGAEVEGSHALHRYFDRRRSTPDITELSQFSTSQLQELAESDGSGVSIVHHALYTGRNADGDREGVGLKPPAVTSAKILHKSASVSSLELMAAKSSSNKNTVDNTNNTSTSGKSSGALAMKDSVNSTSSTLAVPSAPSDLSSMASSSSGGSGFGLLSKTRQFGAWLTRATEGEKVEVTRKDLNVFAPTSF